MKSQPANRCPVCLELVAEAPRPCADCRTAYHHGCFAQGGCVVAGCLPRSRRAAALSGTSALWKPSAGAFAACLVAGAASMQTDLGPPSLLSRLSLALAISCWFTAGGGMAVAGIQDLSFKLPAGSPTRSDRVGTVAAVVTGLSMAALGAGLALRISDVIGRRGSQTLCLLAGGGTVLAACLVLVGLIYDARRFRALALIPPLAIMLAAIGDELVMVPRVHIGSHLRDGRGDAGSWQR